MRILLALMSLVSAAVIGASGYAGGEVVRFLDAHPRFDLQYLGAHSRAGSQLRDVILT